MKYIKKYESDFDPKYNIGDYIILRSRIKYKTGQVLDSRDDNYTYSYIIEFIIDGIKLIDLWFQEPNIERLATNDEIEEFESLKQKIKFNL